MPGPPSALPRHTSPRLRQHHMTSKSLRDQLIVGLASAVILAGALASTHPIYMARAAIVRRLFATASSSSTTLRAPCLRPPTPAALPTPQFLPARRAFPVDLRPTGTWNPA